MHSKKILKASIKLIGEFASHNDSKEQIVFLQYISVRPHLLPKGKLTHTLYGGLGYDTMSCLFSAKVMVV